MAEVTTQVADYLSIDPADLARLCTQYGIVELAVFGSTARHEETGDSDVDLLYTLAPDSKLGWAIGDLQDQLEDLLGRPVDLVSKKYLHKMLREQILHDAVLLYAA